jgi:hypothetical protein
MMLKVITRFTVSLIKSVPMRVRLKETEVMMTD